MVDIKEVIRAVKKYRTSNLFLLIGTNPLPNYVAAKLLLNGGHVYLVHTAETAEIADRLIAALGSQTGGGTKIQVDEAKSDDIVAKVAEHAKGKQDVGLNYTGGTKTMAVYAYRAVERACPDAVFSYLNAQTLSLFIERQGSQAQEFPVARACTLSLSELLALHGYSLPQVRQTPVQPEVCQALANIHSDPQGFSQWRDWCGQQLLQSLPDPAQCPRLKGVVDAFQRVLGGNATPQQVASSLNPQWTNLDQCRKWFIGDWLEEYTLWACLQAQSQAQNLFDDFGIDLQPQGPNRRRFQFDVAVMRGYQLFAISCIASDRKEKCKEHLFEAYIRAHQMGGDEARVGLVCCAPSNNPDSNPAAIQGEIEESWDARGKVRVFGAEHLPDLPDHLRDWFDSQP